MSVQAGDVGVEGRVRTRVEHGGHLTPECLDSTLSALEARLTWRFAGAMMAQTIAIIGGTSGTGRGQTVIEFILDHAAAGHCEPLRRGQGQSASGAAPSRLAPALFRRVGPPLKGSGQARPLREETTCAS